MRFDFFPCVSTILICNRRETKCSRRTACLSFKSALSYDVLCSEYWKVSPSTPRLAIPAARTMAPQQHLWGCELCQRLISPWVRVQQVQESGLWFERRRKLFVFVDKWLCHGNVFSSGAGQQFRWLFCDSGPVVTNPHSNLFFFNIATHLFSWLMNLSSTLLHFWGQLE